MGVSTKHPTDYHSISIAIPQYNYLLTLLYFPHYHSTMKCCVVTIWLLLSTMSDTIQTKPVFDLIPESSVSLEDVVEDVLDQSPTSCTCPQQGECVVDLSCLTMRGRESSYTVRRRNRRRLRERFNNWVAAVRNQS